MAGLGLLASPVIASAQPEVCERPLMRAIGDLPQTVSMVVAGEGLDRLRDTPAMKAALEFLRESGIAPKSMRGWNALAGEMGMPLSQSIDELLGRQSLYVVSGHGDEERHALLTLVSPQTESRVRSRLQPVPRQIEGGRPVLSLENGAFELTSVRSGDGCSSLLLTPRGSSELADALLPVASGEAVAEPLSSRAFWSEVASQRPSPLMLLMLSSHSEQDYCLAGINASGNQLRATIRGTAAMVLASPLEQGLVKRSRWPREAAEYLAEGSRLMVAGYTQAPVGPVVATSIAPATLLHRAISILRLPTEVATLIDGPAIVAVGESDALFTAAIPTRNIGKFAPLVDSYAQGFAREGSERLDAKIPMDSVRVLALGDDSHLLGGDKPTKGAIAWCFTEDPADANGGWWTVCLRTGDRADALAVECVRRLNAELASFAFDTAPSSGTARDVFWLRVRPASLAPLVPAESGGGLRWISEIESRISLDARDAAAGSLTITFDTSLLKAE